MHSLVNINVYCPLLYIHKHISNSSTMTHFHNYTIVSHIKIKYELAGNWFCVKTCRYQCNDTILLKTKVIQLRLSQEHQINFPLIFSTVNKLELWILGFSSVKCCKSRGVCLLFKGTASIGQGTLTAINGVANENWVARQKN